MKKLILGCLLLLAACSDKKPLFEGRVTLAHINKAIELCAYNENIYEITYASRNNSARVFSMYSIGVSCENGAKFYKSWMVEND